MTAAQYQKIYRWFSARPAARRALCVLTVAMPAAVMALYPLLLALLGVRLWQAVQSGIAALAWAAFWELARAVAVPGCVFAGGSLLRHRLGCPRPYEQPGFVPLLQKDTRGHSFPSRHAMSAAVIAMAWLRTSLPVGLALSVLTAAICLSRVLAGVHYPRDVVCGAALGFALGAAGMFL